MVENMNERRQIPERSDGRQALAISLVLAAVSVAGLAPAVRGLRTVPTGTTDRDPPQPSAARDARGQPGRDVRGTAGIPQEVQAASARVAGQPSFGEWAMTVQGRQVFQEFCARCHGGGGEGGRICCWDAGPPLLGSGLTRWQVRAAVRQGIPPGMPAFGDRLSDAQIKGVAAYVQRLGAGVPAE
jgi:cytochrome c oxidase cbb3-type subunit 3